MYINFSSVAITVDTISNTNKIPTRLYVFYVTLTIKDAAFARQVAGMKRRRVNVFGKGGKRVYESDRFCGIEGVGDDGEDKSVSSAAGSVRGWSCASDDWSGKNTG